VVRAKVKEGSADLRVACLVCAVLQLLRGGGAEKGSQLVRAPLQSMVDSAADGVAMRCQRGRRDVCVDERGQGWNTPQYEMFYRLVF